MEVYADNLMAALNALSPSKWCFESYRPTLPSGKIRLPEPGHLRMRVARYFGYPAQIVRLEADLFHILDHGYAHLMARLDPASTIVTVHDIIPILAGRGLIHGVPSGRRHWLAEWSARFYRKAAAVIAVSENTKRDLVEHCRCDPKRIEVIHYGIAPEFSTGNYVQRDLRRSLGVPIEGYLLLIVGDAFYKNHPTGLRVFEGLRMRLDKPIHLIRLGRSSKEWCRARAASPAADDVIEIHYLDKGRMPDLYRAVDCLLFPSWYEGFGLPPLEAMACGTPVVVSDAASLPEAVGMLGLSAAPDDLEGLARLVERVLTEPEFRQQAINAGQRHAAGFSWQRTAEQTLEVYRRIQAQHGRGFTS